MAFEGTKLMLCIHNMQYLLGCRSLWHCVCRFFTHFIFKIIFRLFTTYFAITSCCAQISIYELINSDKIKQVNMVIHWTRSPKISVIITGLRSSSKRIENVWRQIYLGYVANVGTFDSRTERCPVYLLALILCIRKVASSNWDLAIDSYE
jgi:hypothetical protein